MRPALSSEPDTERDPSVPLAAETDENTVIPDDGMQGNAEHDANHEDARTPEESRAEHHTHFQDAGTRVGDTSPARPGEPERRGASRYLRELAESVEALEGHRVDNPIAGSIEGFDDEDPRTCGSAARASERSIRGAIRPDSFEGGSR
jgi:hypothetical protein